MPWRSGRRSAGPTEDISALDRGGYLHDIGKIGIPDALLLKPSALTREEFELMKQHTVIGDRLCGELRSLRLVREIVRHHHERLDGSGYPDGLRGDEVSVLAQIVSTVDLYDACTSARPVSTGAPARVRLHRAQGRSRARPAQPRDGRGLHRSRAQRAARRSRVTITPDDASIPADFSICRGGPVYEIGRRLGLRPGAQGLRRLGLILGLVAWVPLAGLALLDGVLHDGATIPFWPSVGTHVRFLLAIPLFFLAEALFDTRVADVLRRMLEIGLILPGDRPRLAAAVRQAIKARNSWLLEATLAVLTGAFIWAGLRTDLPLDVSTWRATAAGDPTWAGWWYRLVSLPLFQFLFWRWCCRLVIWSHLLWRISRLDLQLIPTHPDAAGGLAVLGVAHVDLAPFGFAGCAVLSSSYAEQIIYAGVPPAAFAVSFTAAVVGTTLLLTAPLLLFLPKLIDAKQRALLEYGTLAATYTRAFAAKWLPTDPPPDEPLLGTPDLQSLADLGSSFDLIRQMTVVPIAKSQILLIAASAALPFAPLVLVAFPLDQLIIDSMKKVLNV